MREAEEQRLIIAHFRTAYPQYAHCLRVSMSGLNYGSGKRGAILAKHVRTQGVEEGEADIAILVPRGGYGSLLIEHKSDEAMRGATAAQLEYIRRHNESGNLARVTKGVDMAIALIDEYMGMEKMNAPK